MGIHCCPGASPDDGGYLRDGPYRRVLWIALFINFGMFLTEIVAGVLAGSVSLQADALDFFADSANYAISLLVIGMALKYRAMAALAKGLTMALFGLWVIGSTLWYIAHGGLPDALTMGAIGLAALIANVAVAFMLWSYRNGDSNMRSVWICSRNDAIGNVAVLLAALGVFGTGTPWPDSIVATVMALLALQGAANVIALARAELKQN
jgi:Co/Zn/Cd efflux system component